MTTKAQVLEGRKAVDAYREAHRLLHKMTYYREVHADHTPLLKQMLAELNTQGFVSSETKLEKRSEEILRKFFDASEQLNLEEAGLAGKEELTEADRAILDGMWH